ncbi:MAG: hypothetical protein WBX15_10385 [Thermoanaerobaculia bacterium]
MRNRILPIALALLTLALPSIAAESKSECTLCGGIALTASDPIPTANVPLLIEAGEGELAAAGSTLSGLTAEQRARTVLVVTASAGEGDPLDAAEKKVQTLVDWTATQGTFRAVGIDLTGTEPAVMGYAVKRLSILLQGRELARSIVVRADSLAALKALYDSGAEAYFDQIVVPESALSGVASWVTENDPAKRLFAIVRKEHPNAFYDIAAALRGGATNAFVRGPLDEASAGAIAAIDDALRGDYSPDPNPEVEILDATGQKIDESALAFVRGEDLRMLVVAPGNSDRPVILSVPDEAFSNPTKVGAEGLKKITDTGKKGSRYLVGVQPAATPWVLALDRPPIESQNVTKESIQVSTKRSIPVEEIVRNHQAYWSYESTVMPPYIATNTTNLRFPIQGGDSIEATIAGPQFFEPKGTADWVWKDFLINGVRWKYGKIPELPLVQPEKVTQLPLDIHLTNDYRYQLAGETTLDGYRTWEVRFEPPPNAPKDLPLYRGTVWIDQKSLARIRISMVQLHLEGEILSNEEMLDYRPFDLQSHQLLDASTVATKDPRSILWLPAVVHAQQVISAAGRATPILRETDFSHFELAPSDFASRHEEASASSARMVRDTEHGLRYLVKDKDGDRVVKEGFDTSRLFMLGGVHHDAGLEFPVAPLGGIDYFNFDLAKTGLQTNVFFAGIITAANVTNPNVRKTRTNLGADFLAIAVPFQNSMYRSGEESKSEAVKTLPINLTLRAGHPVLGFGKVDLSLGVAYLSYQRAQDTASGFAVPPNTFVITPSVDARYDRWGYSLTGFYDRGTRTKWEPWGILSEYDPDQKSFSHFGGSFAKTFYLPKFQRIGVEADYLDGANLDRFSKYELGFFGTQRVHGIRSGAVRAERAMLGHLSYGFVFSDQFRVEMFYDHALIDDATAGYRREPFQGVGLAGQTIGPWGTILRFDIGKSVGTNADSDFVANVVFLKLFD